MPRDGLLLGAGMAVAVIPSVHLATSRSHPWFAEPVYPFVLCPMVALLILTGIANIAFHGATGKGLRERSFESDDVPLLETPLSPTALAATWMRIFRTVQVPCLVLGGYLVLVPVIAFQIFFL